MSSRDSNEKGLMDSKGDNKEVTTGFHTEELKFKQKLNLNCMRMCVRILIIVTEKFLRYITEYLSLIRNANLGRLDLLSMHRYLKKCTHVVKLTLFRQNRSYQK